MKKLFFILALFFACLIAPVAGFVFPELWEDLMYRRPFCNAVLSNDISFVQNDGTKFVLPKGTVVESLTRGELWSVAPPGDLQLVKVYFRFQPDSWSELLSNAVPHSAVYGQVDANGNVARHLP